MSQQKILNVAYHRNGMAGAGFYVALVKDGRGKQARTLLTVHFPNAEGLMSILDLGLAVQGKIGGPGDSDPEDCNAFRFEAFSHLRPDIEKMWDEKMVKRLVTLKRRNAREVPRPPVFVNGKRVRTRKQIRRALKGKR